jgi:hypothetical protein
MAGGRDRRAAQQLWSGVKLTFTQSGGYAGLIRGVTVDTCDLPDDERQHLESLVRDSGLIGQETSAASGTADARQYELVIEDGSARHTLAFDETNKPATATPLLKALKARSTPQRPA